MTCWRRGFDVYTNLQYYYKILQNLHLKQEIDHCLHKISKNRPIPFSTPQSRILILLDENFAHLTFRGKLLSTTDFNAGDLVVSGRVSDFHPDVANPIHC